MRIVLFSGSLRTESLNRKLIAATERQLKKKKGLELEVLDLRSYQMPVYDGDIEAKGIPDGVKAFGKAIEGADALIISSPEYNASMSGAFKNAIDWVSRLRPVPLEGKPILLMGASPGNYGTMRAQIASRATFDTLNTYLFPQGLALSKAHEAFDDKGNLKDEAMQKRLDDLLEKFEGFAKRHQKV